MESYITNCVKSVVFESSTSRSHPLDNGVPQGSVMGPSIFIMHSAPLGDVIKSHGINRISYADYTQLFCTFHPDKRAETISNLERCLCDVRAWTAGNRLKLNDAKS